MSPMNNRLLVPRKTPGLLDLVPGAAAAYSLRSLSNSYAGPVVTVRRSSDDAEEDFTAAEVADGTLAAFCGAGDGFVKQWWDQSGNANHAVAAADTNEPKIVDSGVVILNDGKPALYFDGINDQFDLPSIPEISGTNARSIFFIAAAANTTERCVWNSEGASVGRRISMALNNTTLRFRFFGGTEDVGPIFAAETNLIAYILPAPANNANLSSAYIFGVQRPLVNSITLDTTDDHYIGKAAAGTDAMLGTIQEIIVYPSDLTSQRELIEGNIAWSYSV